MTSKKVEAPKESAEVNINPPEQGNHIALLFGPIEDGIVEGVISWIIGENLNPDPQPELTLMINSEGGGLASAYALIEVMRTSRIPIRTIAMGQCASAGLLIFMSGTKGRRIVTKTVEVMTHHFSSTNSGDYHSLKNSQVAYDHIDKLILTHYMECTGLSEKVIRKNLICEHDAYLTPEDTVKYKMADKIGPVTYC
jgi:ATP-dependent Clp protease protease subunit